MSDKTRPPDIPGYTQLEEIGRGGMGAVYSAHAVRLNRRVAIKTMHLEIAADPSARKRFEREARAVAKLSHDNVIPIFDVDEAPDGTPFMVMPFLKGRPLDKHLATESAPLDLILKVAREVAAGLAEAHAAGLVHRDIKPANVWLEEYVGSDGRPARRCKVLDFGLVRETDADAPEDQLTQTNALMGTPAYMSPEQARSLPADFRTDLFSLGVILYQMATGTRPFTGKSAFDIMTAVVNVDPPPVAEVAPYLPPALADLVGRLMSKDPDGRPPSAAAVVEAVCAIEQGGVQTVVRLPAARGASTGAFALPPAPLAETVALPTPTPTRDRLTELVGAAALMPLVACACAGAWLLAAHGTLPQAGRAALLATALAWAVAAVGRAPVGWRLWVWGAAHAVVGVAIGGLALWLDGWAADRGVTLTGVQYAAYFGAAVCACRWWRERAAAVTQYGRAALAPAEWTWRRALVTPAALTALVVLWPNQYAPTELGLVIAAAALLAQAARRAARA